MGTCSVRPNDCSFTGTEFKLCSEILIVLDGTGFCETLFFLAVFLLLPNTLVLLLVERLLTLSKESCISRTESFNKRMTVLSLAIPLLLSESIRCAARAMSVTALDTVVDDLFKSAFKPRTVDFKA